MKAIWKYLLDGNKLDKQSELHISMPRGAHPLYVINQHGDIQLYVLVNPNEPFQEYIDIGWYGTGHPIPDSDGYQREPLGVVQMDGALVWHFFHRKL